MSSHNIIKDNKSQRYSVENSPRDWNTTEYRLIKALEELELIFEKMPKPHRAQYTYLCPGPDQLIRESKETQTHEKLEPMDIKSRLRANKVFNVLLARLWRRRCAEVGDLHELVRKYQQKANTMRDDLFLRNRLINREQQRCDRLKLELRQLKQVGKSHNCETIDSALNEARLQEQKLRLELQSKSQECNNFAELLNATKTEMFRELSKFRKCAQELAEQQRQNCLLEMQNAELEDEILTLRDCFQSQHDDIVVALHRKQEKLDEAYETLKGFEQELAVMELKHNELMKENQIDAMLHELNRVQHKIGIVQYLMCLHWPNIKFISFEIVSKLLDFMLQNPLSKPTTMPTSTMCLCLAILLLI